MDSRVSVGYKSPCQIARRVTEEWAHANLYCAACESPNVSAAAVNAQAVDFLCPICGVSYQLKALKSWSEKRVPDAAYDAMMRSLRSDTVPNLLIMQYSPRWFVVNLVLVPSFFFSSAAIEKRKPLAVGARRAGWVGCNIMLNKIAVDGKIRVVDDGRAMAPADVRRSYEKVRPLADLAVRARGWTLDVLRIVREIGRDRFHLHDVYAFEHTLNTAYPGNKNIRPKIRQQLQVLRDIGYLRFDGQGRYAVLR